MDDDSNTEQKTRQAYSFGKEMFLGYISMSPERASVGGEGEVIPCVFLYLIRGGHTDILTE